jgi:hypothetical protein
MSFRDWAVWQVDGPTIWVYLIVAQVFAIEYLTSAVSPIDSWRGQMITDHLRPLFGAAPIVWYLALGLWLWLGPHLLAPALESLIQKASGGG